MTLRALATRLGLSITTVSRALDGYEDVAHGTRVRVREAADEMGYRPNPVARRLRKGTADAIALVMPTEPGRFFQPAFGELLAVIGERLAAVQLDFTLMAARPGPDEAAVYTRIVEGKRADACLLLRTRRQDERVAYLAESGFPFLCFGRTETTRPYAFVDGAMEEGFDELTTRLINQGRRRFAHLAGPSNLTYSALRAKGFTRALAQAGLPAGRIVETIATEEGGYQAARILLSQSERPDAIICATDHMALGAYRAIGEIGARIGADIAVTGHDNLAAAAFTDPPLTTMEPPIREAGLSIAEKLIALIGGAKPADLQEVMPLRQLPRASSGEGGG
ncbi:MAG: substrate-binding domain-containing protein [Rhizobiales bacterium]|nr:substrate-binding domain-containing protein [Hyphomicrobiales bacterium]